MFRVDSLRPTGFRFQGSRDSRSISGCYNLSTELLHFCRSRRLTEASRHLRDANEPMFLYLCHRVWILDAQHLAGGRLEKDLRNHGAEPPIEAPNQKTLSPTDRMSSGWLSHKVPCLT